MRSIANRTIVLSSLLAWSFARQFGLIKDEPRISLRCSNPIHEGFSAAPVASASVIDSASKIPERLLVAAQRNDTELRSCR